ncbi:MAG: substrate-binding domain-containing protein [Gammaproteobacteria bacterium]
MQNLMTVAEVAEYLRIKERKVYDLLAQKRIPCTRVTGKWLFPKMQIDRWLMKNSDFQNDEKPGKTPAVLTGSHDPLLEWALRESDSPLALQTTGSLEGLNRFAEGGAMVCGIHVLDAETGEYNIGEVRERFERRSVVLIEWARRRQGILLAKGNPLKIVDLNSLLKTKARIVGRQPGSGGRLLFESLILKAGLEEDRLNMLPQTARSETDMGLTIIENRADAGIGLAAVARQLGLDFIPLTTDRFDLIMHQYDYFEPPIQSLLRFARSEPFLQKAREMEGYDVSELGAVRLNVY